MQRIGDLLPETARRLGLDAEFRLARGRLTWDAIVGELVPAAAGACRLVAIEGRALVIEADHAIVAQELRLQAGELLAAFGAAPGGATATELRVRVRRA
jgi:predicted nucleic acid-binding Zn ribbon protein